MIENLSYCNLYHEEHMQTSGSGYTKALCY